jgi:hypothetical protein
MGHEGNSVSAKSARRLHRNRLRKLRRDEQTEAALNWSRLTVLPLYDPIQDAIGEDALWIWHAAGPQAAVWSYEAMCACQLLSGGSILIRDRLAFSAVRFERKRWRRMLPSAADHRFNYLPGLNSRQVALIE